MSLFDRRLLGHEILPGYGYYLAVLAWMLLLLPWQVHTLGDRQWAVVAFCLSLHALLFGLDLALAPLLLRAAGERSDTGHIGRLYLHSHITGRRWALVLALGLMIGLAIGTKMGLAAPMTWPSLILMLALFLFQIQNAFALAIWNGRGQQRLASGRSAMFLMVRHGFASVFIGFGAATAETFLLGLVLGAAIEWQVNRRSLLRQYPPQTNSDPSSQTAMALLPWSLASAALALLGSQLDRLWLGVQVDAASFGAYVLICTPLAAYLSLQLPIQRALMPRLSRIETRQSAMHALWQAHFLLMLPCLVAAPFSDELLAFWLRDQSPVLVHAPILSQLLLALAATILAGPAYLWLMQHQRWSQLLAAQSLILLLQCVWFAGASPDGQMTAAVKAAFMPGLVGLLVLIMNPDLRPTLLPARKDG